MASISIDVLFKKLSDSVLSVPIRTKIAGMMLLPVLILGFALNYWVRTGLSDWLSYLLSDERVQIAMQAGGRSVLMVTTLAAMLSILLTFVLLLVVTKPLLELREVGRRVVEGDLASRSRIWARDEIGEVADSINSMIDRLVADRRSLEHSNRRLEAVNRVAIAIVRERDLQDVLNAALQATLDVMKLESGWIFLRSPVDPGNIQFSLASQAGIDDETKEDLLKNGNFCACQRDLLSGKISEQATLHRCNRASQLADLDQEENYHITIPIKSNEQKFGMLNLLCREGTYPTTDDLEILTTIGAHISEFVANAWLNATLLEKELARQSLLEALVRAQENERARLSRELHDGSGQTLTSLLVRLKTLEKRAHSDLYRQEISQLCNTVSETIEHVQEIAYRLRPAALEEFGLEVALRTLVHEMFEETNLSTVCSINLGGLTLPFEVETNLYRIAQESLTNIVRHAGASHVQVGLTTSADTIHLLVEDDGRGFDPREVPQGERPRHMGLMSMLERAEMLGGTLTVNSAPEAGTVVKVEIPLGWERTTWERN